MKKNSYGKIIKDGIITQNPVLVQVLGMCPTLAVSTQLMNGLGMGAAVTAVLIFSNLFISLLRRVIDKRIRIASFIVIIAGFVTMVEMLMKAFLPSLSASLGVYIPLIVVNCIILARAEAFASRNRPLPSVVDGLACGAGFTAAICIVSAIRELLGTGALLGYDFKLIPPIMIFSLAPGGLLVLGFVMAFCAWISGRRRKKAAAPAEKAEAPEPGPKPTGDSGKVMEKAPVPPRKVVIAEAAEASPVQGEVAPKAPEGLSAAEPAPEPEPAPAPAVILSEAAAEPAPAVILSEAAEAAEPKDPLPVAEASPYIGEPAEAEQTAGDSSSALPPRNDVEPTPEPAPAPETQMTFAAVQEAEAPAPEESAPEEKSAEPVSFASEEERESALAAAIRYFGGMETSSAQAEPAPEGLPADGQPPAGTPEPAPAAEASPAQGKAPEGLSVDKPAPAREPAPAPARENKRGSLFARRKADAYDDDLEPPSFMSEPVTRIRDTENKEERDDG